MNIYIVEYNTLINNYYYEDNFIYDNDIDYSIVYHCKNNIFSYIKIWIWCFVRGILPDNIFLINNSDNYIGSIKKLFINKLDNENINYYVDDDENNRKGIVDLNCGVITCNFKTFKKLIK